MRKNTIQREAGDAGKGFRLQQIRAAVIMLDSISVDKDAVFFTAVEHQEDVSHKAVTANGVDEYYEEDKNYNAAGSFTIFSPPVKNTLVSFIDIYFKYFDRSPSVFLGFYTTRVIGKEIKKGKLENGFQISLSKEPILSEIQDPWSASDKVIELVKNVVECEYCRQYKSINGRGNLDLIEAMSLDGFRSFLSQIDWRFGQADEQELKKVALKKISSSPLFENAHVGREQAIFSALVEKISEKQARRDLIQKQVHSSDVKLIFKEAESSPPDSKLDPSWQILSTLEEGLCDERNLRDKVFAVVENCPERRLGGFSRKASASKYEQLEGNKAFLSLKYRVFEACEEVLSGSEYKKPICLKDLELLVQDLVARSDGDIKQLERDYFYPVSSPKVIESVIWDLVDTCFIAFEGDQNELS